MCIVLAQKGNIYQDWDSNRWGSCKFPLGVWMFSLSENRESRSCLCVLCFARLLQLSFVWVNTFSKEDLGRGGGIQPDPERQNMTFSLAYPTKSKAPSNTTAQPSSYPQCASHTHSLTVSDHSRMAESTMAVWLPCVLVIVKRLLLISIFLWWSTPSLAYAHPHAHNTNNTHTLYHSLSLSLSRSLFEQIFMARPTWLVVRVWKMGYWILPFCWFTGSPSILLCIFTGRFAPYSLCDCWPYFWYFINFLKHVLNIHSAYAI